MKIRYDQEVDVLYLCLKEGNVTESDEVRPGIIISVTPACNSRKERRFLK